MSKRIYVKPELTILEFAPSAMISASLGISDYTTDTFGRSREYDNEFQNNNIFWNWEW